jgi:hypothetical protein
MTLALDHGGVPAFENLAIVVGAMKPAPPLSITTFSNIPKLPGINSLKSPISSVLVQARAKRIFGED